MDKNRIYFVVDILVLGASVMSSLAGNLEVGLAGIGIYLTGQTIRKDN